MEIPARAMRKEEEEIKGIQIVKKKMTLSTETEKSTLKFIWKDKTP
jgi:hypothetical protein